MYMYIIYAHNNLIIVHVKTTFIPLPIVVCLCLIWDSDQPPVDDIMAVVNNIGLTLQLNDVCMYVHVGNH